MSDEEDCKVCTYVETPFDGCKVIDVMCPACTEEAACVLAFLVGQRQSADGSKT